MPSTIRVRCENLELRSKIQLWLDRCELSPRSKLTLSITVGELSAVDDDRPVFRQPSVEIRSGPPLGGVSISWLVAPALAVIPPDSKEAHVLLSQEAARRIDDCIELFLITVLVFLLRRAGWHHIHGATTKDQQGRGWLVAGDARAGKSTTAALFASRGWPVGTDDTAFLRGSTDDNRILVQSYRAPIALRKGGYALINRTVGTYLERRSKYACRPEELGGEWLPKMDPSILLFTRVGDKKTAVSPISSREALTELVRWSAWVVLEPELAQEHLDLLRRLAAQAQGYRVTLGRDLFEDESRLTELIP